MIYAISYQYINGMSGEVVGPYHDLPTAREALANRKASRGIVYGNIVEWTNKRNVVERVYAVEVTA